MAIDQKKLEGVSAPSGRRSGGEHAGVMTTIGHKLGLYKAMADAGPITSSDLAQFA